MAHILVTGASGGFGQRIVKALLAQNHKVAAAMRAPSGKNKDTAEALSKLGASIVELDVTNDASAAAGFKAAREQLGALDTLINNAGLGGVGLQETFTVEDFKKIFEVNLFGVQRTIREALPAFHEQKSGLIINISSLLGRFTLPFYGPYNASKWALEAVSENYRTELSAFGIEICLVEPGGYPTTFHEALTKPSDLARAKSYGNMAAKPEAGLHQFEQLLAQHPEQDPENVAKAVAALVALPKGQRPFRTIVDSLGMGQAIAPYNQQLERITETLYGHFGMADMLKVKG